MTCCVARIEIDWAQVDCQILLKSDGMPTYHLANVVDDHLMAITHVMRGEEWINSAPKHQLLYEYFGWDMPALCHMPLLRNPDKSKLSKRKNPTSINFYERMGFLPEAVTQLPGAHGLVHAGRAREVHAGRDDCAFRYPAGLPGWAHLRCGETALAQWAVDSRGSGRRKALPGTVQQWWLNSDRLMPLVPHLKSRVEVFSDIAPMANFMFAGMLNLKPEDFAHNKLDQDEIKTVLQFTLWRLEAQRHWTKERIFADIKALAKAMELKMGDFMFPVFVAIAGTPNSWSVMDSMALLGPDMTRARLRHALEVLGGFSKKETKRVEKEFAALDAV